MSSDESDGDDDEQYTQIKHTKYLKSLSEFHTMQQYFEDQIPRVAQLPDKERVEFVFGNYEKYLFSLHERPRDLKMNTLPNGINEFQMFCNALRIGWKLWPDWWTGLQMMLDYLSEDTRTEDLEQLDFPTLAILKEIAKCENWPNNQICGPRMTSPQAKAILIRFERKCSYSEATGTPSSTDIGELGLMLTSMSLMNPCDKIVSYRVCDGVHCFKVEAETVKFKKCGRCKKTYYCSKDCQASSWKGAGGHNNVCHS